MNVFRKLSFAPIPSSYVHLVVEPREDARVVYLGSNFGTRSWVLLSAKTKGGTTAASSPPLASLGRRTRQEIFAYFLAHQPSYPALVTFRSSCCQSSVSFA